MAEFFRIGREWHTFGTQCSVRRGGKVDEVTDDPNHIYRVVTEGVGEVCDECAAEICWAYMLAEEVPV